MRQRYQRAQNRRAKSSLRGLTAVCLVTVLTPLSNAAALDVQLLSTGAQISTQQLSVSDQAVVRDASTAFAFAGRQFEAARFSGLLGFSSDAAFIAVSSGKVLYDGQSISAGEAVILPPFGVAPAIVRYDAGRLIASWGSGEQSAHQNVYNQFQTIARKQKRAIFFGRLTPTSLNVAAPGSANEEAARRTVVGADVITQIRYQDLKDQGAIERAIVSAFITALKNKDQTAVAALLDPTPFGRNDLRGTPGKARMMMAQALIDERNWSATLGGNADVTRVGDSWRVLGRQSLQIILNPIGDFAFVSSVNTGDGR